MREKSEKKRDEEEFLARNGGWVLLLLGVTLIGLAVVVADQEALASIFAFSGIAAAVLGVLLPRLKGNLEFSPTRLAATLKEARSAGVREDLTFEDRANEILRLLGISGSVPSPREPPADAPESSAKQPREDGVELPPVPTFTVGMVGKGQLGLAFERHVMEGFKHLGWEIESEGSRLEFGVDFIARREGAIAYVQVKLARRFTLADLDHVIASFSRADSEGVARHVLAINSEALSATARERVASIADLEVVEVPVEGW
jgi:Holliday junction resolvase-like predicted endonuclease